MPTIITHSIVGLSAGITARGLHKSKRFWLLSLISPALADADVIAFAFGIPYSHFLGHRGFFHSLTFALILALMIVLMFFRDRKIFSRQWNLLLLYFFILNATHGILDTMTSGGLGIALFAPFDNTRYFLPFTPIQVAPIGFFAMFSEWGKRVMISEIIWVWLPLLVIVGFVKIISASVKWVRRK